MNTNDWGQSGQGGRGQWGNQGNFGNEGYYQGSESSEELFGQPGGPPRPRYENLESFAGRGPKTYQRTDNRIYEDVCERLTEHPDIDASGIEVDVKDGEVTLSGATGTRGARRLAVDLAEEVRGVKNVQNQIRITNGVGT